MRKGGDLQADCSRISLSPSQSGYPAAIKRLALDLAERGEPAAKIRTAVLASCGRAPTPSNWSQVLGT